MSSVSRCLRIAAVGICSIASHFSHSRSRCHVSPKRSANSNRIYTTRSCTLPSLNSSYHSSSRPVFCGTIGLIGLLSSVRTPDSLLSHLPGNCKTKIRSTAIDWMFGIFAVSLRYAIEQTLIRVPPVAPIWERYRTSESLCWISSHS